MECAAQNKSNAKPETYKQTVPAAYYTSRRQVDILPPRVEENHFRQMDIKHNTVRLLHRTAKQKTKQKDTFQKRIISITTRGTRTSKQRCARAGTAQGKEQGNLLNVLPYPKGGRNLTTNTRPKVPQQIHKDLDSK